jgi:hypothetical protein
MKENFQQYKKHYIPEEILQSIQNDQTEAKDYFRAKCSEEKLENCSSPCVKTTGGLLTMRRSRCEFDETKLTAPGASSASAFYHPSMDDDSDVYAFEP